MATRSTIAILNTDGTAEGIYAHWDGYLSGNGQLLKDHYNTEEQVRELIALGDLSSLRGNLSETMFYHRDCDEDWKHTQPRKSETLDDLPIGEEYNYVFDVSKNEWLLKWDGELISFEPTNEFNETLWDS